MWLYLFGRNDRYPDPILEIEALARLDEEGEQVFLKLSARDDAPLKNAVEGEHVYLCTREEGRWWARAEANVIGLPIRSTTPASMTPLYGPVDERHWWRRLGGIQLYDAPRSAADLGLVDDLLPKEGQAHVIRVPGRRNGKAVERPEEPPGPLDRLTAALDAASDAGRVTTESIEEAIRKFRAEHPYGR